MRKKFFLTSAAVLLAVATLQSAQAATDVQKVIDNYETLYTKKFMDAGFKYESILNIDSTK